MEPDTTLPRLSHAAIPQYVDADTERAHRKALKTVANDFGRLEKCMGNGVAGCVYECQEYLTGERVAIKVVHHDHFTPEEVLMGFARHPNVARMLWWSYSSPYYLIAYDFVPNAQDAASVMATMHDAISERMIARVIRDVAKGLKHLHSRGVAHMDLKLENVLLVPTDDHDYRAMLIDFGSAKIKDHGRKKRSFYFAPCVHNDHVGAYAPCNSLKPSDAEKNIVTAWKHCEEMRKGHKCSEQCAVFKDLKRRGIVCSHSDKRCTRRAITLSYCPPELALKFDFAGCDGYAVDAYALGIMIFRMAFGHLPYTDDHVQGWYDVHEKTRANAYFRLPIPKSHPYSNGMIRLMLQLTNTNPFQRTTVKDVLSDPWIRGQLSPTMYDADAPPSSSSHPLKSAPPLHPPPSPYVSYAPCTTAQFQTTTTSSSYHNHQYYPSVLHQQQLQQPQPPPTPAFYFNPYAPPVSLAARIPQPTCSFAYF